MTITLKRLTHAEFEFIAPQLINDEFHGKPAGTSGLRRVYRALVKGGAEVRITYLAMLDGVRAGIATVGKADPRLRSPCGVLNIFVLPEYRGKGIGTKLLTALCAASEQPFHVVFTDSATPLFLNMGFDPAQHYSVAGSGRLIHPARTLVQ